MREHELFSPLIDWVDELELIRRFVFSLVVKYGVFWKFSASFMIEIIVFRFWHLWLSTFSSELWKSSNALNWFTKFLLIITQNQTHFIDSDCEAASSNASSIFIIYLINWTPSIQLHFAPILDPVFVWQSLNWCSFLDDLIKNAHDFRVIKCAFVWMQTSHLSPFNTRRNTVSLNIIINFNEAHFGG